MTKKKSQETDLLYETISLLKAAPQDWPQGCENELIRGILERAEQQLLNRLFEIQYSQRTKKAAKAPKSDAPNPDIQKTITTK